MSSPSPYSTCDAPERGGHGVSVGVGVAVSTGSKVPVGVRVGVGVRVAGMWMTLN